MQPGEEKAQGNLVNVHKYLVGGKEEREARLFSVIPRDKTRDYGFEMKHRRPLSEHEETLFYGDRDQDLTQVAQRNCRASILKDSKNPHGHGPRQMAVLGQGSCWRREV